MLPTLDLNRPATFMILAGVTLGVFLAGAITAALSTRKREAAAELRGYERARLDIQRALATAAANDPVTLTRLAQQAQGNGVDPGRTGKARPCGCPDPIPGIDDVTNPEVTQ